MSHRPGNVERGFAEVSEPSRIVILAQHDQQASVEQIRADAGSCLTKTLFGVDYLASVPWSGYPTLKISPGGDQLEPTDFTDTRTICVNALSCPG